MSVENQVEIGQRTINLGIPLWLMHCRASGQYLLPQHLGMDTNKGTGLGCPFAQWQRIDFFQRASSLANNSWQPQKQQFAADILQSSRSYPEPHTVEENHGIISLGKDLRDHWAQLLTQHCQESHSRLDSHFLKWAGLGSHPFWALTPAVSPVHLVEFACISSFPAFDFIPPTVIWLLHESNSCWQCCVRPNPFEKKPCWHVVLHVLWKGVLVVQGHCNQLHHSILHPSWP